jgi:hypothetical protein
MTSAPGMPLTISRGGFLTIRRPCPRRMAERLYTSSPTRDSPAAKVGIADMSGSRLAQHRRNGWQILAVFQVSAKSAAAIETNVLKWWRVALGLPSYLTPSQMPQGGWTETVAASRIDLTETMTRICKLAVASPPPGPYVPGRVRG